MQIKIEQFCPESQKYLIKLPFLSEKIINENIPQLGFFNRIIQYFPWMKRAQNQPVPHFSEHSTIDLGQINPKDLNELIKMEDAFSNECKKSKTK